MKQRLLLLFLPAISLAAPASLPRYFEENRGQSAPEVRFLAPGSPGIFFSKKEAVIAFAPDEVLRIRLKGAAASPPEALEVLPGKSNYLNRAPSITGIRQFGRIRYRSVYPGIDVVYHGRQSEIEYDFNVAPGAHPERIRLKLQGASSLGVDAAGNLVARLRDVTFIQRKPEAWQNDAGIRRRIDVRYFLTGKGEVAFAVGAYDRTRPLIIDPLIDYITHLGAPDTDAFHFGDKAYAIAADSAGNAYLTGEAPSAQFPITTGTARPSATGDTGYVAKLSADGTHLIYSTYLNLPAGRAIAVDDQGSAYVAGSATSSTNRNYIVKLTPDGSASAYSYFFSTSVHGTSVSHLVLDSANNVYVSGGTRDSRFPTTRGAYQETFLAPVDIFGAHTSFGFLIKLNAAGNVAYSTYLRDPLDGVGVSGLVVQLLAVDRVAQNAMIVTVMYPAGPAQLSKNSLLKLDAFGERAMSTTTYEDPNPATPILIKSIATDAGGNLFLVGDGPGFGTQLDPSSAWFLARISPSGAQVSSRHVPFSGDLSVDRSGNAYIVANLRDPGGSGGVPSVVRISSSTSPVLVFALSTTGITDQIQATTADPAGNVYVVLVNGGRIGNPPQIPATPGAFQTSGGGFAVVKVDAATLAGTGPPILPAFGVTNAASGQVGPIAPGEILTLYPTNFGPEKLVSASLDANGMLPTSLAGTRVLIGGQPIPLLYTSASQIAGIVPSALTGVTTLQAEYQGMGSPLVPVSIIQAVPGLFTSDASGRGQGAIVNEDGSINSISHPAPPGSVVSLFCSGCGVTDPTGVDGAIANSLAPLANPIVVTMGGQHADVSYAGSAPGLLNGAVQINAKVPLGIGGDVPISISVGFGPPSPPVTLVVR